MVPGDTDDDTMDTQGRNDTLLDARPQVPATGYGGTATAANWYSSTLAVPGPVVIHLLVRPGPLERTAYTLNNERYRGV